MNNFEKIRLLESKNVDLHQQNTGYKNTLSIKFSENKLLSSTLLMTEENIGNSKN